jgi:hypothetical protein
VTARTLIKFLVGYNRVYHVIGPHVSDLLKKKTESFVNTRNLKLYGMTVAL